ncbi:MAG: 4Fe-4S cluster-binding domain-containing protein [Lachnospiraceae bacterium]|nr:4Fe-4S cluster-binding domain-containing protein [Lachnospiraceae bacterium]
MLSRLQSLHRALEQTGDDMITLGREHMVIRLPSPYRSAHCEVTDELLSLIDVLVDGKFIFLEKDLSLRFRGSRNQRLIDVKASLSAGKVTLWQG